MNERHAILEFRNGGRAILTSAGLVIYFFISYGRDKPKEGEDA